MGARGHDTLTGLAASEARLRALMDQASDAILILDLPHHVIEANREAERLLGRPRAQIVGHHYDDFVPPGERADSAERTRILMATGAVRVRDRHLVRGDGLLIPVEVSASIVHLGHGEQDAILAIIRNLSEREQAEQAVRQAQERLEHVVSSSPSVLYLLAPSASGFVPSWISANIEDLLGFTREEALAPGWWERHVHPDDRELVSREEDRLYRDERLVQEYRFRARDGRYRWLRAETRLLRHEGREPEVVGSWSDVTARKEAELRLADSERQYRILFESNPHPMWVYDVLSLRFLAVNTAAVQRYGYTREEFLARDIRDIRPPDDVPRLMEQLTRSDRDRTPVRHAGVYRHRTRDGSVFQVEIASSDIVFEGRAARLVLAVDVTEKQALESQLRQAQKMESVGRLAGGVAHDFNNMLGVISGYGELLRKRVADERLRKYADDILKAADRAAGLTRQLLAFSRRQVLQPKVLDLNEVVSELERMLRRLIGEDIRLVVALHEGLPPIKADAGQLEQVLMNLVVNARDAMPTGGRLLIETGRATFDAAYAAAHAGVELGSYVMVAVSDTGEGMTPEVRAQIFEPFFTTKGAGKGTGLGLATVHGIVRQSGGHVFVYSEPGRGSTFKIYFPAVEESLQPARPPKEEEAPRGTETILVVEDEAALRDILRECLEAGGYRVLEAADGLAALKLAESQAGPIDLLVTDVVMPGMGGSEIARQLAAQRPDLKVLYMSGYTDDAVVLHGVLGAEVPFLEKPFTAASLARKIREVLDRP
jgi:PAS domain S-box-containing protein